MKRVFVLVSLLLPILLMAQLVEDFDWTGLDEVTFLTQPQKDDITLDLMIALEEETKDLYDSDCRHWQVLTSLDELNPDILTAIWDDQRVELMGLTLKAGVSLKCAENDYRWDTELWFGCEMEFEYNKKKDKLELSSIYDCYTDI